ncbi:MULTISPECIES: hypothetical protein [Halobacterium]|uniref:hypothetical protein n=1 Tax=Halobacterium TaxID=2239 RepID=UPI00073F4973|nr:MULTISPECIES: hypothetical protein [Halobacterium]MCG1003613.1 hypothetical protein [Halobacterium noricense]
MPADFADSVYLASLHSEDLTDAFGEGYATAAEPPAVSDLLRSLADTRAWATRDTDVLADLDRGDYVFFHREFGLRCVGQVWSTTADSSEVARYTDIESPAGEWGLVTLTNVQPALDHVSLLSLGMDDARRDDSLYRLPEGVAADLRAAYTTPARLVEDAVANPLAFDVPPDGTPGDRRPDPERFESGAPPLTGTDTVLDAHLDALDSVHAVAWRVLGLAAFLLAATLAVVAIFRPPDGSRLVLTGPVSAGVAAVAVGTAIAAGVAVHAAVAPRPGLAAFTREQAAAVRRAGTTESSGDAATHVAGKVEAFCTHLATRTRRLGFAVAAATVAVLVGCVYVAYGLGAQVSPSVEPLSAVALAGFPVLVVAATLVVVRHHVRAALPDAAQSGAIPTPSVGRRLDALKRRISGMTSRFR